MGEVEDTGTLKFLGVLCWSQNPALLPPMGNFWSGSQEDPVTSGPLTELRLGAGVDDAEHVICGFIILFV